MRHRLLLATAGIVALVATSQMASAKTLVYCSEGSPEGFYPGFYTAGTTFDASSHPIFSRLVEFINGTTKTEPGLAESWTISDDGLVYTFHLRKGVKFQTTKWFTPTRDLNADDVVFSFERQLDKKNPYYAVGGGTYEYFDSMSMPELLKSVEKVDDYTVKLTLTRPEAPMIADLAMDFASITSKEYADKMMKAGTPEQFDLQPVGTGPFQLQAYQKDAVIRYTANPTYFRGKAPIDNLIFAITTDASVRLQKLKANECQIMAYPNPADIAAIKADPDLQLMQQPGLNVGYLGFNTAKKPFTDVRVRKALAMAINKEAIIQAVFQSAGTVAKNPIPPTMWGYNDAVKDTPYDPEQAKKLLAEAGYPDGFETDIWAMPVQRPYMPNARRTAEMIQADWQKVGVKAKIVSYEWGEYLKRSQQGEQQSMLLGWTGDNGDPDNFLAVNLSCDAVGGSNRSRWCYKPFDDLIMKAKQVSDQGQRAKLYEQAQVIFKEQVPWVTLDHSLVYMPMRKDVVGYKMSPLGYHDFYGVDIKG